MTKYTIPVKFTSIGEIEVEAETNQIAVRLAENQLIARYQFGNPTTSKDINWIGAEAEVDGDEIDLDRMIP